MSIDDLLKKDDILLSQKYGVLPDKDFSPKRNKDVIERTIKKAEERRAKRMKEYGSSIAERSEAVASFFQHVNNNRNNDVEKYFGRKLLAQLRGEDILTQLKGRVNMFNKNAKA